MRRHRKQEEQPAAKAKIEPRKGLIFSAFMDRREVGAGERVFLVLHTDRRGVTLYYPPLFTTFRMKPNEWAALVRISELTVDRCAMARRMKGNAKQWEQLNLRFSRRGLERALATVGCRR